MTVLPFIPSIKGRNATFLKALEFMALEKRESVLVTVRLEGTAAFLQFTQKGKVHHLHTRRITDKGTNVLIERLATLRVVVGAMTQIGFKDIETDSTVVSSKTV